MSLAPRPTKTQCHLAPGIGMRALSMEPTSPLLVKKGRQTIYVDYFDDLRSSANAYYFFATFSQRISFPCNIRQYLSERPFPLHLLYQFCPPSSDVFVVEKNSLQSGIHLGARLVAKRGMCCCSSTWTKLVRCRQLSASMASSCAC